MCDGKINEVHWEGSMDNSFQLGHVPPTHSIILCRYYKNPPSCVSTFNARIYYVVHKLPIVTRACIHFGSHNHHVSIGGCCESIMITKELMRLEVEKNQS